MFLDYVALLREHSRFLAFGFLLAFTSSAGQTYFIGVFGPEIQATFNLSHTQWGSFYLIGTLASALVFLWSGQLLDRIDLRVFTIVVVAGLAVACFAISQARSAVFVVIGIFLLRHMGQGLTSHTAITSIARYLDRNRGKGIAIASMGFSVGEAVLPFIGVLMIAVLGWRQTYGLMALAVFCIVPIALWLLRGHAEKYDRQNLSDSGSSESRQGTGITRRQMLSEARFYFLLPAIIAPSLVMTGLFFHHLTLADTKQWSAAWVTGNYWVYALFSVVTSVLAGPLIDRFTAARVVPLYLLPISIGLLLLVPAEHAGWVIPYMLLMGMTTGLYFTGLTALWAELYGTRYLGAIKSVIGAIGVFASALGPVIIGFFLDFGLSFEMICLGFVLLCVFSTMMLILGLRRYPMTTA